MPIERDYPIYLHCATCKHCTRHHMIFDGAKYTDLVCQGCKKSATCAPKAAGGGK
jgi:hypothetical protein